MVFDGLGFGPLTVSAGLGPATRRPLLGRAGRLFLRPERRWTGAARTAGLSFSMGALDEKMGPLGAYMPTRSDFALPSRTRFAALGGDLSLGHEAWS